jgi:hypothetical protein
VTHLGAPPLVFGLPRSLVAARRSRLASARSDRLLPGRPRPASSESVPPDRIGLSARRSAPVFLLAVRPSSCSLCVPARRARHLVPAQDPDPVSARLDPAAVAVLRSIGSRLRSIAPLAVR